MNWLGRYASVVDHLGAVKVAQGALLRGRAALQPPRTHGQKPSRTMYRTIL
jgi:hypothetical protein